MKRLALALAGFALALSTMVSGSAAADQGYYVSVAYCDHTGALGAFSSEAAALNSYGGQIKRQWQGGKIIRAVHLSTPRSDVASWRRC